MTDGEAHWPDQGPPALSAKMAREKVSGLEYKNFKYSERDEAEAAGWIEHRTLKRWVQMKRKKAHGYAFGGIISSGPRWPSWTSRN